MVVEQESVNYPDILGAITGGPRLNLDVIQLALALRPPQVPAGQFFEILLLLQNASDIEVDVTVTPELPARDAFKKKGLFTVAKSRLLIGLHPAEVGYVVLPVSTSPATAISANYVLGLSLEIKRMAKKPQRTREPQGGGEFIIQELPAETQAHMKELRQLIYSVDPGGKKNYIRASFAVLPPALARLKEYGADWVSLWSMRDYMDEYVIAERVWGLVQSALQHLKRDAVFMPLLKATQARHKVCNYDLHPPEAIFVTKLLTLVLELGADEPTPVDPRPPWPRWFGKLCRLLLQEPGLATQVEPLVARLLFADLVYDSIMYGFTMVSTVTGEEFGTEEETHRYAEDIVDALTEGKPLDFARVYFPMVLGGLIAHTRVTMPREQVRETVFILSKALEQRQSEKNADNAFIFDITAQLIDRALDSM